MICVALCRCCTCSISFTGTLPLPAYRKVALSRDGGQVLGLFCCTNQLCNSGVKPPASQCIIHLRCTLKSLPPLLRLGSEVSREGVFALLALRGRADTGACSGSAAAVPASLPSPYTRKAQSNAVKRASKQSSGRKLQVGHRH